MKKILAFALFCATVSALTCTNCGGLLTHTAQKGLDKNVTVSNPTNASARNASFAEPVLLVDYLFFVDGMDETGNPAYEFTNVKGKASWTVPLIAANSSHTFSLAYTQGKNRALANNRTTKNETASTKTTANHSPQLPPPQPTATVTPPALLLVALVPLLFLAFRALDNRVTVKRRREEDRVTIAVENRKANLRFLELTDLLPEKARPRHFSEKPEAVETVAGLLLKWHKDSLEKGETWRVSYSFDGEGKTSFSAVDPSGEEISL